MTATGKLIEQSDTLTAQADALMALADLGVARMQLQGDAICADTSRNPDHMSLADAVWNHATPGQLAWMLGIGGGK